MYIQAITLVCITTMLATNYPNYFIQSTKPYSWGGGSHVILPYWLGNMRMILRFTATTTQCFQSCC